MLFAQETPEAQSLLESILYVVTYQIPIAAGGEMRISIASLTAALITIAFTFYASRILRGLLERRLRGRVADSGISYTIQRLLHYVVLTLGILFALRVGIGVDYTSLAVLMTALSVGIGLGLKEIASDVAAGFVLLFERPVRVGDRVRLPGELEVDGNVVAIGLRTTRVITNDRVTVIVPNSKLTNEKYINWSYLNEPVRLHVPVGIAYGTDIGIAKAALLEAAKGVDNVLAVPAPEVRMIAFGESALQMELLVWTREPVARPRILSDVNFKIERHLRDAGIEVPFPQSELRLRTVSEEVIESLRSMKEDRAELLKSR